MIEMPFIANTAVRCRKIAPKVNMMTIMVRLIAKYQISLMVKDFKGKQIKGKKIQLKEQQFVKTVAQNLSRVGNFAVAADLLKSRGTL